MKKYFYSGRIDGKLLTGTFESDKKGNEVLEHVEGLLFNDGAVHCVSCIEESDGAFFYAKVMLETYAGYVETKGKDVLKAVQDEIVRLGKEKGRNFPPEIINIYTLTTI